MKYDAVHSRYARAEISAAVKMIVGIEQAPCLNAYEMALENVAGELPVDLLWRFVDDATIALAFQEIPTDVYGQEDMFWLAYIHPRIVKQWEKEMWRQFDDRAHY